jgi:hypothetical protein
MTTIQILAVLTPVAAFAFMGAIALFERRYDRAPAAAGLGIFKTEVALGDDEEAKGNLHLPDKTASSQSTDVPEATWKNKLSVRITFDEIEDTASEKITEASDELANWIGRAKK